MISIDIMMEEHRIIERMIKVIRNISFEVMNGKTIDYHEYEEIIKFIKGFADGHHHNKEEIILFNRMISELGVIGEKTIKHGMLVEHDLGRLYIRSLVESLNSLKSGCEEARLDVIANAISYTNLLKRHIHKEDNVIYKFALRELTKESLLEIDKESMKYEEDNISVRQDSIRILEKLERKYVK